MTKEYIMQKNIISAYFLFIIANSNSNKNEYIEKIFFQELFNESIQKQ